MATVQLIGSCPANIRNTPPWDPTVERWCANDPHSYEQIGFKKALTTYTAWFNVHSNAHIKQRHPGFFPWLESRERKMPVYTLEPNPGCIVFPGRELIQTLKDDFFTHQAAWLVAFAMVSGFTRIELWGYQFGAGARTESPRVRYKYAFERPCIIHWLARARERGIEVFVASEAKLHHKEFLYGYEGPVL